MEGNGFTAIAMKAEPGKPARIDPPVELFMDHQNVPLLEQAPVTGLSMGSLGVPKANAAIKSIYWLANGDLKLIGGGMLSLIAEDVRRYGAFLLLSGGANRLDRGRHRERLGRRKSPRDGVRQLRQQQLRPVDVEGKAFGRGPSHGTERRQEPVSGFTGPGLVNSYNGNDDVLGKLKSPSFPIHERYISFLIGGGQHPGKCCMNLVVDGKVVRTETGQNTEQLRRVEWDVNDLVSKDATIEIVDQQTGEHGAPPGRRHPVQQPAHRRDHRRRRERVERDRESTEAVPPMTAIGLGKGRAMLVPVELAAKLADSDAYRQRDHVLSLIAKLAEVSYQPPRGRPANSPSFGTMCLAMPEKAAATSLCWTDADGEHEELCGRWHRSIAWGQVERCRQGRVLCAPQLGGQTVNGGIWKDYSLDADQAAEATFIIAWHFPNQYYPQQNYRPVGNSTALVGNMYANWFADATAVVRHVVADLDNLRRKTYAYRDAMFNTTLPQYLVDAAAANVSILRSPTCFWTKDGTFYGFEGCRGKGGGCCPMNCNHVWNYEQTLAKLWPSLERNMRITELKFHQEPDGGLHHRVSVPRRPPATSRAPWRTASAGCSRPTASTCTAATGGSSTTTGAYVIGKHESSQELYITKKKTPYCCWCPNCLAFLVFVPVLRYAPGTNEIAVHSPIPYIAREIIAFIAPPP